MLIIHAIVEMCFKNLCSVSVNSTLFHNPSKIRKLCKITWLYNCLTSPLVSLISFLLSIMSVLLHILDDRLHCFCFVLVPHKVLDSDVVNAILMFFLIFPRAVLHNRTLRDLSSSYLYTVPIENFDLSIIILCLFTPF